MSYLLDKKIRQKKFLKIILFVFGFFILFYFRIGVWNGLSYVNHVIFRPILILGNDVGEKFRVLKYFFSSKNSLSIENENLKNELKENKATMSNYFSVLAENIQLKEILGRKSEKMPTVLATILSKPNQSPYDTLLIDAGVKQGVKEGNTVFALGNVPIGRVANVYPDSSKMILFSNPGEKTNVVVGDKNIFMEVVGRGGGSFEMIIPQDFTLTKGSQVVLPGVIPYVLAIVETIISDPRDLFVKALLTSPVNVQELKFVEIRMQK